MTFVKTKENKAAIIKRYNIEEVSVKGFCNFCRNNVPLIIAVSITLFFTYGIRLFWYSIGFDTQSFWLDKSGYLRQQTSFLRFGLALLSKILYANYFNPFTVFYITFCLIWFFTISWCYIIAVFSRNTGRNNKLIPFALVFMTMPVWAEQFYFVFQSTENAIMISLCPYVIYLLFKSFLDNERTKIICASVLLAFMPSVYQAITPMFCCGVFICFVLLSEHTEYEPQVYRNLCLKLLITLLASIMLYFLVARMILAVFHIEKASYVEDNSQWGKVPIRDCIMKILSLGYTLTVGNTPLFQRIVNPIIANYGEAYSMTGAEIVEYTANVSRVHGNILLFPAALLFLISMAYGMRRNIPTGRRFLYMLAGIGIPLSIILFAIVTGTRPPMRTLYALPLAFAFMLFYLIRTYKKKPAVIVACLSMFIAAHQAQITAQLFYSDQLRYNEDVRLAYELKSLISKVQPEDEKLPVVITGRHEISSLFKTNFIKGGTIGYSFFELIEKHRGIMWQTIVALSFMKTLGINFEIPDENQVTRAVKEAALLPPYPDPGCVKRMQDYIVVRLSENLYADE